LYGETNGRKLFKTTGVGFNQDRCILVTDAIAPAGKGPGRYRLGRWNLQIGPDLVARSPDGSHLIGSGMTMHRAAENLVREVGLSIEEARRLTSTNPRGVVAGLV
jgi:N-acetylglucosamine-6-phosphate deacetylase